MKHIKKYNESKIDDYKFSRFYKSVQLIYSELFDSGDVDIWKHSDEHNFDRSLGEFVKVHISVPKEVWSPEDGSPENFNLYIEGVNKWSELLQDIDVCNKRIKDDYPNCNYHFEYGNDYVELIFIKWD